MESVIGFLQECKRSGKGFQENGGGYLIFETAFSTASIILSSCSVVKNGWTGIEKIVFDASSAAGKHPSLKWNLAL
mgnify:CR=1 FL=1